MEYKEVTGTVSVPKGTGIEGFLHTVRSILTKRRVQEIKIDAKGSVHFRRVVADNEEVESADTNFGIDFDFLQPYNIIRNTQMRELSLSAALPAPVVLGLMFDKVAADQLKPTAFVTGADSSFWEWYRVTSGAALSTRSELFGIQVLTDRSIPDSALLLCAGYARESAFHDIVVSYKFEIPMRGKP